MRFMAIGPRYFINGESAGLGLSLHEKNCLSGFLLYSVSKHFLLSVSFSISLLTICVHKV